MMISCDLGQWLNIDVMRTELRIDNGGLALISLWLTFLFIASCLLCSSQSTIHQMKATIVSY